MTRTAGCGDAAPAMQEPIRCTASVQAVSASVHDQHQRCARVASRQGTRPCHTEGAVITVSPTLDTLRSQAQQGGNSRLAVPAACPTAGSDTQELRPAEGRGRGCLLSHSGVNVEGWANPLGLLLPFCHPRPGPVHACLCWSDLHVVCGRNPSPGHEGAAPGAAPPPHGPGKRFPQVPRPKAARQP